MQKTIRFWFRSGYAIMCLALAITVISLNYEGCDEITGVRRGISAGTIMFWFVILRHTIHHREFELELINRPGALMARNTEHHMLEIHHMNIMAFIILFLFNLPVMLYYKLYNPDIPPECVSRHGYDLLLALLGFNSFPAGIILFLYISGFVSAIMFYLIRLLGFWISNYLLKY